MRVRHASPPQPPAAPCLGWQLAREAAQHWAAAPVEEQLQACSPPLCTPLAAEGAPLPRFGALTLESCACDVLQQQPGEHAATDPAAGEQQQQQQQQQPSGSQDGGASPSFPLDSVFFAGGPVWALAWAPLLGADAAAGPLDTVETLAAAVHPRAQRRNPAGTAQAGPGCLQLWGVPASMQAPLLPGGMPQLLALLWHEGRVAWDVAWCPDPAAFIQPASNSRGVSNDGGSSSSSSSSRSSSSSGAAGGVPLQGLLAAVLGSGDVVVLPVPTVQSLIDLAARLPGPQAQQQRQERPKQRAALSLRLPPLFQLASADVSGSLASCCAWLPSSPHDQLLVGHWDGNVAIWQLPTSPGGAAAPVAMVAADPSPVRGVAWQPDRRWWLTGGTPVAQAAALAAGARQAGGGAPQLFASCSAIGNVRLWDARDLLSPAAEFMVARAAIHALAWLGPPHVLLAASGDGCLRAYWLDAGVQAATGSAVQTADVSSSCGCLWALAACPAMGVAAFVGDGGLLGLAPLEPPGPEPRHRKSHAALSALAEAGGQLWLLSAREIPGNGGLFSAHASGRPGSGKKRKGAAQPEEAEEPGRVLVDALPHPDQVLHAVAFSPNYRGLCLLACGGGGGLVRLHALSAEVVPAGG